MNKSRYYIVDLETRRVMLDRCYDSATNALDEEKKRSRLKSYAALRGSEIIKYSRTWILPLTDAIGG